MACIIVRLITFLPYLKLKILIIYLTFNVCSILKFFLSCNISFKSTNADVKRSIRAFFKS